jgi:glutathione-specific gamma-glutamylcyclotransferase
MWVFAYGSLMSDGWEEPHECVRRVHATLPGFSRIFDKASIESRGTRNSPAPTLRLISSNGSCRGIAFELPEGRRRKILKELLEREGQTFPLREALVTLDEGEQVIALVTMYEGGNLIRDKSLSEIAAMAIKARGTRGSGIEYVQDIQHHLHASGIDDSVVTDLWEEIQRQLVEK